MKAIRESEWFGARPRRSRSARTRPAGSGSDGRGDAGRLRRHPRGRAAVAAGGRGEPRTSSSASSPVPTPGPVAVVASSRRPWPRLAEELGVPVLKPEHPRDPDFQAGSARPGAGLLPGRRLRRPAAAVAPSTSRRTAGSTCTSRCCRPGAARRRCSARSGPATRSPARRPSGSCEALDAGPDVRRRHRDASGPPTPPATCSVGSPRPGRRCSWPPSTASRPARSRSGHSPRTGVSLAPKVTVEEAEVRWADPALRRRPRGASLHARARVPGRRSTGSG